MGVVGKVCAGLAVLRAVVLLGHMARLGWSWSVVLATEKGPVL